VVAVESGDVSDIQARALEGGVPYQTLIAGVLHKYVTGRLAAPSATELPPAEEGRETAAN
jgi:hypothetical protein